LQFVLIIKYCLFVLNWVVLATLIKLVVYLGFTHNSELVGCTEFYSMCQGLIDLLVGLIELIICLQNTPKYV